MGRFSLDRCERWLLRLSAALLAGVASASAEAMSRADLERELGAVLDCRALAEPRGIPAPPSAQLDAYLTAHSVKGPDGVPEDGKFRGDFPAFGVVFRELFLSPWAMIAFTDQTVSGPLLRGLERRGLKLAAGRSLFLGDATPVQVVRVESPGATIEIAVISSRVDLSGGPANGSSARERGTTFVCARLRR